MAVKVSEMIFQRVDLARRIEVAIEYHLPKIAEGYAAFLESAVRNDETALDTHAQLLYLGRRVAQYREMLQDHDHVTLEKVLGSDTGANRIEGLAERMERKLRSVRSSFRGMFGLHNFKLVGLEGVLPRRPLKLRNRVWLVKSGLENPQVVFRNGPQIFTPEKRQELRYLLADSLEPELGELSDAVDKRYSLRRENEKARLDRKRAIEEFDQHVRAIIRLIQGMFSLAGRPDLVSQFRWKLRNQRRRADQPAQEPEAS